MASTKSVLSQRIREGIGLASITVDDDVNKCVDVSLRTVRLGSRSASLRLARKRASRDVFRSARAAAASPPVLLRPRTARRVGVKAMCRGDEEDYSIRP
jgi:hypothetical protein